MHKIMSGQLETAHSYITTNDVLVFQLSFDELAVQTSDITD